MPFWDSALALHTWPLMFLGVALCIAFLFEVINGFHDTANAVATVIYTHTLSPTPAVIYSGFMNFLGALITVLFFGAAVAFTVVNLLPVDLLVNAQSAAALVMVVSLLLAGVIWNLGTWYLGLPVSSSHTLIGCVLGVGIANSFWDNKPWEGVNWLKAAEVGVGLVVSPMVGFLLAGGLLLLMKRFLKKPGLYQPPHGDDRPPAWIRLTLILTCGTVSFAHGSNDGQKGMGLLLLVLIGYLPTHYALNVNDPEMAPRVYAAAAEVRALYEQNKVPLSKDLGGNLGTIERELAGKKSFEELPGGKADRWNLRLAIMHTTRLIKAAEKNEDTPLEFREKLKHLREHSLSGAIEFVPLWVVVGTALALGIGTTIGYKRIVVTVAEKIGKTHLTYAQGAAAEAVAATTILAADMLSLPVSTTHVLSSGVAGTMSANGSGVQGSTIRKIFLAWVLTMPAGVVLSAALFTLGRMIVG
jgi:phosphate/sulfate permease